MRSPHRRGGGPIQDLTNGQGADATIITIGVVTSEQVGQGFSSIRKGGTVVVTGMGKKTEVGIPARCSS